MNLPPNMGMDIDDFVGRNIDNYNNIRGHSMTSNKNTSRTISMFSSKTLVNYATKIKQLNNISNKGKTRDLIDSSQLFYTETKKI